MSEVTTTTATTNLGRVSIVPKGDYDATVRYSRLDVVKYNRDSYLAKTSVQGVTPGTDATKWMLLVEGAMSVPEAEAIVEDLEDDVAQLKSAIDDNVPIEKSSGYNGSDLDISDPGGHVLLRLEDGHVKTKLFDSSEMTEILESIESDAELDISDLNGNVAIRYSGGDVQTQKFDSALMRGVSRVYSATGTGDTITVSGDFKRGDVVVLQVVDGLHFYDLGNVISYYEDLKLVADHIYASNMLYRHRITTDCNSIRLVYHGGTYTPSASITFNVYKLGCMPILPTVVTVKQDGTGNFTTIRGAVDYVNSQNPSTELNPFIIEVYPGTYNVFDDYTQEEIEAAEVDGSDTYTQTSFVGPKLTDGVSMRGVGNRESIVINGELSTDTYNSTIRNNISTLNLQGSNSLENLFVKSKNIRYAVHDDWWSPYGHVDQRRVINCKFSGSNFPNNSNSSYGAGMSWTKEIYFKDCEFIKGCGIHLPSVRTLARAVTIVVDNCVGDSFGIGDSGVDGSPVNTFVFNNCRFKTISISGFMSGMTSQHCRIIGNGNIDTQFITRTFDKYRVGSVVAMDTNIAKGKVVDMSGAVTTTPGAAYGVCIGVDDDMSYVQYCGYVNSRLLGLTVSVGDYVTIDGSGNITGGGTAETAIGKCVYKSGDVGQIKLNMIGG